MKRLCSIIVFAVLLSACKAPQYYQSHWHNASAKPVAAVFHQQNDITITVSNNVEYLYIEIESSNTQTIEKIKKLGLSVWLSKGKTPRKTYGIHYPLPYKDASGKAALEGFAQIPLLAMPLSQIAPVTLSASFLLQNMKYKLKIPLTELSLSTESVFTIYLTSFTSGKEEYLSSLTSAQEIERRLDDYKVHPKHFYNTAELTPFFNTFQLAKMPNKNL